MLCCPSSSSLLLSSASSFSSLTIRASRVLFLASRSLQVSFKTAMTSDVLDLVFEDDVSAHDMTMSGAWDP